MKFTTAAFGNVTGMRFYKASANTGTHVGSLWNSVRPAPGPGDLRRETASGWQTVDFSTAGRGRAG